MLELAKSAIRLPWALSLFGAKQMASLLNAGGSCSRVTGVEADLYSVGDAAAGQMGNLAFAAFQVADEVQSDLIDFASQVFSFQATPAYLDGVRSALVWQASDTLRTITPGSNLGNAWQQLQNNYEVFNLVQSGGSLVYESSPAEFDLPALVRRAYALGQYPALWAVEGLGHDYAASLWGKGPMQGILLPDRTAGVPENAMTMLHAGIGLFFAQTLLPSLTPYEPANIRKVIGQIISLVRSNSRPGYEGAAFESLGLVTRFWHSPLVGPVYNALLQIDPEVGTYFWHGVGRALYFLPIHFVPGLYSPWIAVESEPPDETARLNAIAGLAWATTVVNIRQPEILASFVSFNGDRLAANDAFTNGVMSVTIMVSDIVANDVYVDLFRAYQPLGSDPRLAGLWTRLVQAPVSVAVDVYHPALRKRQLLGRIFHYQDLNKWAG
jgi:hypothetical protein